MIEQQFTALLTEGRSLNITGLRGGAMALFLARASGLGRPLLCISPAESNAQHLAQDLSLFTGLQVLHYPSHEVPPYTPLSPDRHTVADRLAALYQVHNPGKPFILVLSLESLLRKVMPRALLANLAELVIREEDCSLDELTGKLVATGYEAASLVQSVGEFSVRGGILDLFPPGFDLPVRLDFFGDTVESIRSFDPISQRSVAQLDELVLLPAHDILYPADEKKLHPLLDRFRDLAETKGVDQRQSDTILSRLATRSYFPGIEFLLPLFYENSQSLLEYLPKNTLIFQISPLEIKRSHALCWERVEANYREASATGSPVFTPDRLFLSESDLAQALTGFQQGYFHDFTHPEMAKGETIEIACGNHSLLKQELLLERSKGGILPELADRIRTWLEADERVSFACRTERHAKHLADLLRQYDLPVAVCELPAEEATTELPPVPQIRFYPAPLCAGFDLSEEKLHWLSESELFGETRLGLGKKKAAKRSRPVVSFEELNIGDMVVHAAHGLGSFQGIVNLELNGVANDFFLLSYRDQDKLYVPVDQLKVISKYKGIADSEPKLDKLGGKAWQSKREKIKAEVWQVAQALLNLYAHRALAEGQSFSPPGALYRELEESFPYDETPGQLKAIGEVLDDLCAAKPMDRLICGDVGYGKTEVAVRAAFKVVEDGGQVAILVPTTVLAEQHAATFRDRLQGLPSRVESLTRFRSASEQRQIVQELAAGRIDIIIGTHRLLSKDVSFKRLGLLIIDEEHRFGVSHKEKIKQFKTKVDVLTLTATPIPRTLQLSLLSIRDLSVISSPPEYRRPVKTFVARDDDLVIREALIRELQRDGQVFLVHNRVHSIHAMADRIKKLVPEARLAVAHGQMPGKDLEEVMFRFVKKEVNVLICTTIIESGLDIPNANTIIITRADRLGLAEIYQLRGRVGRGREQAYAYLLVPSLDGLSADAQQRLRALMDYNELGGGFKLAMSDLQIRGGGNILGISQSGNIAAVGYDLYLELLQQTIFDMKRRAAGGECCLSEEIEPEINLRISAFFPASYIAATEQRYIAYRRLTSAEGPDELADLINEFEDRYGPLPPEARSLFTVIDLKLMLRKLWISKLERGPDNLVFTFHEKSPVSSQRILEILAKHKKSMRFTPEGRLIVMNQQSMSPEESLQKAQKILAILMGGDN